MGQCYITRRGSKNGGGGTSEQLGVYPIGSNGRPTGNVTVPDNVTTLSSHLFQNNSNVLTVNLPNSLTEMNEYAFQNCTNLQTLNIPDTVTEIPAYCFDNCSSLALINLPQNLVNIKNRAFQKCNLSSIRLPESLTSIGEYGVYQCNNLETVIFDENATVDLNKYCFSGCNKLNNESAYNIMEHCNTVSDHIFASCLGLTNVEVKRFWTFMFQNCSNLISAKSLVGANTGNSVFSGCTKLQEMDIADGTTTIGTAVFTGCTSLKRVYLPSSITTATSSSLTSTSTSYYIFNNCTALENVQLGEDWDMSLRLNVSNNLTIDSMLAMFESLKDLTGTTSKTLTLGSTNIMKLTDEQRLIALNKNWTLA